MIKLSKQNPNFKHKFTYNHEKYYTSVPIENRSQFLKEASLCIRSEPVHHSYM